MNKKGTDILNSFIKFPQLRITWEKYPYKNFDFFQEEISESNFNFPKESILGMQAEACFRAYLVHSKNYELLASNLQIYTANSNDITDFRDWTNPKQRHTLGELDFIAKNLKTYEIAHIELACKFYLYESNAGVLEEEKWIGPNRNDRLSEKLEKVKIKQFSLLHQPETVHKLSAMDISYPSQQLLCLKASLFIPKKMDIFALPIHYQKCVKGYWIRAADFKYEDKNALYAIPNKKEWLLPYNSLTNWIPFDQAKSAIRDLINHKKSPLIYRKQFDIIDAFFVAWW